ncbi:tRNA lysidine(34) synthetase TilS [Hoeflea poritis]|uniref:tRNA(Ile)-lysidine synthase n=1 Tax=Hoeflea poritis TaxID=2993659 RepID=A0ABT4VT61_9HYPH|nr:tRNA lysidine(34) synthetase TilS [Hoeflea poritis]MDA4847896.1 tRNA lysidine(34) synthetase TilS [Hoeflea poritis]
MSGVQPEVAIETFISRLRPSKTLCVAVSGGSDSTALLHLLDKYVRHAGGPRLVAVTVDHGLRAASAVEAKQVADFCKSRGIRHITKQWTGKKPESGLQDAARNARYELLREAALSVGAAAVISAHTRDDQLETIRMRQRRGMGRGLSGMAEAVLFRRDCWILRPLLTVSRGDLRAALERDGIGWIDDPSNDDRRFERVRVRQEGGSPEIDSGLLSMVDAMAAARRKDGERLARFLHDDVVVHGDMLAELPLVPEGLSDVLQQAVALMAALLGGRAYLPGSRSQDQIARLVAGGGPPRVNLSRSVIDRRARRVFVYRERRSIPTMRLPAGGQIIWDGRYRLVSRYKRRSVLIGPADDAGGFVPPDLSDQLPPGVVSRAARARPALIVPAAAKSPETRQAAFGSRYLEMIRYFTHFDLFLPDFERSVADECAALFGLPPYPEPPL